MKIAQLEASYNEINYLYDNQQITKEEYLNLLQGLTIDDVIVENSEELHRKETLHSYVNAAITAVSSLA